MCNSETSWNLNKKTMKMKRKKIKVSITKEKTGYSAHALVGDNFIATEAETFEDLKANILEAVNLAFEDAMTSFNLDAMVFEYELESFFEFYNVINAKALSERIGMNQSLLAQYIKGLKKPSASQTKRILQGVQQIGRELTEARFLM